MAVYFLDTSAVVKAYINEKGSGWTQSLISSTSGNRIYISLLTGAEVISAITRRAHRGDISSNDASSAITLFRNEFSQIFVLQDISYSLIDFAMDLAVKHALRGYDAVQLSAALTLRQDRAVSGLQSPIFVSADNALNIACASEGLVVDDPNLH